LSVAVGGEGEIWAATEGAGIYHLKNGQWFHYGRESGLLNTYVWSVSPDAGGRLWAGTWGEGVFVQQGDSFRRAPGLYFHLPALALLHEADGATWVGTSAGLVRYRAGQAEWIVRGEQMASPDVRCIARDGEGTLWFGMFGGGLGCLKEGKLQQFRKSDGLPSDFVQCLRSEADGSLWIGTFGGGLARLKHGRFAAVGRHQGLPTNDIGDIEADGQGFFWISSNKGILRVSQAELNACADGLTREIHCRFFAANDGVPTVECSGGLQPAGGKTPDGRLLFPSSEGLVTIDPGCIRTNLLPPPVYIERVLVDDHTAERNPAFSPLLQIPPGRHRVEVRYTGLSYSAPDQVLFKYRLEGMDKDWVPAGVRRAAHYSYLPPGKYTFHVIACNNDAVWNETGAQLAFAVQPYFWQTLWFRILAGATALSAVGGIVWLDARRRLQRKLERIQQQHAVEQERLRIAHDIHDDLGAYLTRIIMLCDPARGGSGNGQQATASLQRIHETASELTEAMAETVWAVNPHHDTLDSLINYLQKFAQAFLEHAGIRCRLDVPFQLPAWSLSAETRHNLFLAFKETLNNIVKHAGASEVHIGLTLEPAGFLLVVRDNGRGFTNGTAPDGVVKDRGGFNGGNGLRSLQRRMAGIGGRCEIRSVPPHGTSVQFKVPIRMTRPGRAGHR
jgi:signal transduction histidine kinase